MITEILKGTLGRYFSIDDKANICGDCTCEITSRIYISSPNGVEVVNLKSYINFIRAEFRIGSQVEISLIGEDNEIKHDTQLLKIY